MQPHEARVAAHAERLVEVQARQVREVRHPGERLEHKEARDVAAGVPQINRALKAVYDEGVEVEDEAKRLRLARVGHRRPRRRAKRYLQRGGPRGEADGKESSPLHQSGVCEVPPPFFSVPSHSATSSSDTSVQQSFLGGRTPMALPLAVDVVPRSWPDASMHCTLTGGRLVSLHSRADFERAQAALRAAGLAYESVWIGGNDRAHEGSWVWVDGTPVSGYVSWVSGEPNNSGDNEDCLQLRGDGYWNDARCSRSMLSICEGSIFPPSPPIPPPTPPAPPPPLPPPGTVLWRLDTTRSNWRMCFTSNGALARRSCDTSPLRGYMALRVYGGEGGGGSRTIAIQSLAYEASESLHWRVDLGLMVGGVQVDLFAPTSITMQHLPLVSAGVRDADPDADGSLVDRFDTGVQRAVVSGLLSYSPWGGAALAMQSRSQMPYSYVNPVPLRAQLHSHPDSNEPFRLVAYANFTNTFPLYGGLSVTITGGCTIDANVDVVYPPSPPLPSPPPRPPSRPLPPLLPWPPRPPPRPPEPPHLPIEPSPLPAPPSPHIPPASPLPPSVPPQQPPSLPPTPPPSFPSYESTSAAISHASPTSPTTGVVVAVVAGSVAMLGLLLAAAVWRRALRRRGMRTRLVEGVSSSATSPGASERPTPKGDEEATTAGSPSASKAVRASVRTAAEVELEERV